jgi:hypothetical protein
MSEALPGRRDGEPLAKGALASAVLAVLGFFILGFTAGDWWFVIGLIFGAVAVILGVMARSRLSADSQARKTATIGLVVGGIIVAWFLIYMIVAAVT